VNIVILYVEKGEYIYIVRETRNTNRDKEKVLKFYNFLQMALKRARISGVDIPLEKRIEIALTYVYGIGRAISNKILIEAKVNPDTRTKDLKDEDIRKLNTLIGNKYKVEGELRQIIFRNIKRLKDIRCYRGIRHKLGLPVRGQRTRTNAVTRKGRNIAVGGLKRKLEKT